MGRGAVMGSDPMALMKGTVDVLILKTVSWGPLHGYAIARWINETTKATLTLEEGALYPALRRIEKRGLLASEWGKTETGREAKFYALTSAGEAHLEKAVADWTRYAEAMSSVLHATPTGS